MQNQRSLIKRLAGWGALAAATARAAPPVGKRRLGVLLFDNAERWDSLPPLLLKELARLGWVESRGPTSTCNGATPMATRPLWRHWQHS